MTLPGKKLSLCMIMRDEERFLPQCLAAARPFVDEIVIADTGSTDRSVSIARTFGARVIEIPWPGHFAEARNVSLEAATGDWILVLDADEVIRPETAQSLRSILENPRLIAAHLSFVNHYDEKKKIECLILRLFRSSPRHRFTGAIHEQVLPSILATAAETGQLVVDTSITVDHFGYTDDVRRSKAKDDRNRALFEVAVTEEPRNAYLRYKYADFLRRFDDPAAVVHELEKTLALLEAMTPEAQRVTTYGAEAFALYALEMIREGRLDEADRRMSWAAPRFPATATFFWVRGQVLLRMERWLEAEREFSSCRAMDGRVQHVPAQPGITGGRALFGIARSRLGRGEATEARRLFLDGAAAHPDCRDLVLAAAQTEAQAGEFRPALERCMRWLEAHPEDGDFWDLGAVILAEAGVQDRARQWAGRAQATEGVHPGACAVIGEAHLLKGEWSDATRHFLRGGLDPRCTAGRSIADFVTGTPLTDEALVRSRDARRKTFRRLSRQATFFALVQAIEETAARRPSATLLEDLQSVLSCPSAAAPVEPSRAD